MTFLQKKRDWKRKRRRRKFNYKAWQSEYWRNAGVTLGTRRRRFWESNPQKGVDAKPLTTAHPAPHAAPRDRARRSRSGPAGREATRPVEERRPARASPSAPRSAAAHSAPRSWPPRRPRLSRSTGPGAATRTAREDGAPASRARRRWRRANAGPAGKRRDATGERHRGRLRSSAPRSSAPLSRGGPAHGRRRQRARSIKPGRVTRSHSASPDRSGGTTAGRRQADGGSGHPEWRCPPAAATPPPAPPSPRSPPPPRPPAPPPLCPAPPVLTLHCDPRERKEGLCCCPAPWWAPPSV